MSPAERYAYDEHLSAIIIQNDVLDREGRMEKNGRVYRNRTQWTQKSKRVIITGRNSEVINEL